MRILVTGSSGFLGSWICRVLSLSHEVCALVRPSSDTYRLLSIENLQIVRRENSEWPAFVSAYKPDVLILADWWGVKNHDRNEEAQFENLARMQIIALAAQEAGVGLVIGVGSQAELGPVTDRITQDLPDHPTTKYGMAKSQTRKIIHDGLAGSSTRFAWIRIFSTYGPLDADSWLIPSLIDTLSKARPMDLTLGEQEWSYLHAFDLARAFQATLENKTISGIVNVGNPQTINLKHAIGIIAKELKAEHLLNFGALEYRGDQVMKLEPACESLSAIGWKPIVAFEDGVRQTIQWQKGMALDPLRCEDGQEVVFNLPPRR